MYLLNSSCAHAHSINKRLINLSIFLVGERHLSYCLVSCIIFRSRGNRQLCLKVIIIIIYMTTTVPVTYPHGGDVGTPVPMSSCRVWE